jgi:hypothetical protein
VQSGGDACDAGSWQVLGEGGENGISPLPLPVADQPRCLS